MRRRLLAGAAFALLVFPATGQAQSGGSTVTAPTGGAGYGTAAPALTASRFVVTPRTLAPGAAASFRYRIDGAARSARVRIELLPAGARRPAARIRMGWKHTGHTFKRTWTPPPGVLTAGDYVARLHAVDRSGRTLRRTATASGRSSLTVVAPLAPPAPTPAAATPPVAIGSGVFPVRGAYTWGDPFGAIRGTATHRGQDLLTAEGTPIATPRGGVVSWRAYQASGAGNYVVVHADDGRDFVFMHLQTGSITVTKGAALTAGQVFARAGSTGHATGPHLHFEIWPDGWYASDVSQPIDPAPDLRAWAAAG
jgi:murein DD-endopeptidase MepM/ murein hydrolase activator NlpD